MALCEGNLRNTQTDIVIDRWAFVCLPPQHCLRRRGYLLNQIQHHLPRHGSCLLPPNLPYHERRLHPRHFSLLLAVQCPILQPSTRKHFYSNRARMADREEPLRQSHWQRWPSRCSTSRRRLRNGAGHLTLDMLVNAVGTDHLHTLLQPTELLFSASRSL